MCEALNYNELRMRCEFFLEGIRNNQLKSMLNATIVTTIRDACTLLLFKDLNRPVEEADEFAGETKGPSAETSTQLKVIEQMQQMNLMLMQQQQQQPRTDSAPAHVSPVVPRSPRRCTVNAAVPRSQARTSAETAGQGADVRRLNIKMGPDTRTQQGETVCGRCERRNCSRLTCPRGKGTCNTCGDQGHFSMECDRPGTPSSGGYRNGGGRFQGGRTLECALCDSACSGAAVALASEEDTDSESL